MKTLLCHWYGEPVYEEDAPREKLIEIIKFLHKDSESTRKQHERDLKFFIDVAKK